MPQELMEFCTQQQRRFDSATTASRRKEQGHFGTPGPIAEFMAGQFANFSKPPIRILDPGAGVGILSAAACKRALAGLTETDSWSSVTRPLLRIWDLMAWMREHYQKDYAANSRETIRRQSIHQLEQARLVDRNPDNPTRPTNSGDTVYQLTEAAAKVLASFGKRGFASKCAQLTQQHGSLTAAYNRERLLHKIPVELPDGRAVTLSPGPHNVLQCLIIQQFAPRFAA